MLPDNGKHIWMTTSYFGNVHLVKIMICITHSETHNFK